MQCIEHNDDCAGEVLLEPSTTGHTESERCRYHRNAYLERMRKVIAGLNDRYPGWQTPGSAPPAWFDPANAGETWDDSAEDIPYY